MAQLIMVAFFGLALAASIGLLAVMIWRSRRSIVIALRGKWHGPRIVSIILGDRRG